MRKILLFFLFILCFSTLSEAKLKIGVSMLPYYSFTSNIVKNKDEVVQILPSNVDVHSYQPSIDEVKKIADLDVIVINGTGADNYIYKLIEASNNKKVKVINSSKNVALLAVSGERGKTKSVNTHTYIGTQTAIQQVNTIAKELAKIDPTNSKFYLENARAYNKKLSALKAKKLKEINKLKNSTNLTVATTHGGYDYILGELGIKIEVVIEPRANVTPSASDLKESIDLIKKHNIGILFESEGIPSPYSKQVAKETGIIIVQLLHMTNGKYTPEAFEKDLEKNFDIIIDTFKKLNSKNK